MRQTAGENEQDYLVRIERLSRDADLGTTMKPAPLSCDTTNGLRDINLQRELMARITD